MSLPLGCWHCRGIAAVDRTDGQTGVPGIWGRASHPEHLSPGGWGLSWLCRRLDEGGPVLKVVLFPRRLRHRPQNGASGGRAAGTRLPPAGTRGWDGPTSGEKPAETGNNHPGANGGINGEAPEGGLTLRRVVVKGASLGSAPSFGDPLFELCFPLPAASVNIFPAA